jgi:hypothetical protein
MQAIIAALNGTAFKAERNRGQSYECRITNPAWPKDASVWFSVKERYPALGAPLDTTYDKSNLNVEQRAEEGYVPLVFADIESGAAQYSDVFEDRLQTLLNSLAFPAPKIPQ